MSNLRNNILEHLVLPFGDMINGSSFIRELNALRSITTLSEDKLETIHNQKLMNLLNYATENSTYYSQFKQAEISDIECYLKHFPILDKNILSLHSSDLLTENESKLIRNASSGSTGQQSIVYWSKKEQSINRATQILWWEWAGYRFGQPILQTGITPNRGTIKSIKDKLFNTFYLQAFTHKKDDVIAALLWAKSQKKPFLAGYASSLFVLATFAIEHGIEVNFNGAVCWGDKLFDHYKTKIKQAFNVDVHETYGSAEGLMMGAQHDSEYMYLMSPNVHIEIVDNNNNEVHDGELGNVLVTNLNGYAMPLIRYRIGDLAIKLPIEQYPENRKYKLPLWQKIIGRDTDLVRTPSGKYLVVHSFTGVFEHLPEIKQFCVIQENISGIRIQYIPANNFHTDILEKAKEKLLSYIKEPFEILFEEVEYILPTKSGKPQLIISKIKHHVKS